MKGVRVTQHLHSADCAHQGDWGVAIPGGEEVIVATLGNGDRDLGCDHGAHE